MNRNYKTASKTLIAQAYGFQKAETIVARIRAKLHVLTEEQLLQLGEWTGHQNLLPDQVCVIVELLGKPSEPTLLYTEN